VKQLAIVLITDNVGVAPAGLDDMEGRKRARTFTAAVRWGDQGHVVPAHADAIRPDDIKRHPSAFSADIIIDRLKSTGVGGDDHLSSFSTSAYCFIEVSLAIPDHVGKAGLKERQLKTSPVVAAATVGAACAEMYDSGHDSESMANG